MALFDVYSASQLLSVHLIYIDVKDYNRTKLFVSDRLTMI